MAAVAAYIPLLTLLQLLDTLKLRYKYKLNFIDPKQIDSLEEKVLYLVEFLENLPPRPDDPQIEPFILEICDSVVKTCQVLDFQVVEQIRRARDVEEDEGGKWLSAFREDMIKVIRDLESIRCKVTGFSLESATLNTVSELPLISTDPSSSNSTIKKGDPKVIGFIESLSPGPDDPQIKPFVVQICDSVVSACHVLVSHVVDQIRRAGKVKKNKGGKWLSAFRKYMICLPLISTDPSSSNSAIKSGYPKMIGFEHHTSWLEDELTDARITKSLKVISIVGMGGIGKTTLARFVYEDPSIRRGFDKRYWVTISQEYDLLRILQGILDDKDCDSIRDLGTNLYHELKNFRYLIVLDDMWDLGAWEDLKQYFPEDNQGSRIIVTTRDKNLADGLRSSKTCDVGFLSKKKSWELFCDRVFGGMCYPSELETIGKQIVKKCRGLPLGIITIAGLLSKSNKTCEYWSSVSKDVAALVNLDDNERCKNILSLSYDRLPLHLKPLFLYIGEFYKEDSWIKMEELIRSLVAFALVRPISDKPIQQVTKDYLMELFQRNLIFIRTRDEIGEITYLGIHDLLRDLCLKENKDGKLFSRGFSKLYRCTKCIVRLQGSFYLVRDVGELCGSCEEFDRSGETSPSSLFWNIQVVGEWKRGSFIDDGILINDIFWNSPQLTSIDFSNLILDFWRKSERHISKFERLFDLGRRIGWTKEMSNAMPSLRILSDCYLAYSSDVIFPPLERLDLRLPGVKCLNYPQSLRYLYLECGKISCDQMNGFGMLPNLESLTVHGIVESEDAVWNPNEDGFRRLKYLRIRERGFCKYWCIGSDIHFPQLETLGMCTLHLLEIPRGLKDIESLRKIELDGCHKNVVSRAKWILKQQRRSGNDQLRLFIDGMEKYDDDDEGEDDDGDVDDRKDLNEGDDDVCKI